MATEKSELITRLDFREQMLYAIAYRVSEMCKVRPEIARNWVRDCTRRGTNGEHFEEVAKATFEMFQPFVGAIFPMVPTIVRGFVSTVQAENNRGWGAETKAEAAAKPV